MGNNKSNFAIGGSVKAHSSDEDDGEHRECGDAGSQESCSEMFGQFGQLHCNHPRRVALRRIIQNKKRNSKEAEMLTAATLCAVCRRVVLAIQAELAASR